MALVMVLHVHITLALVPIYVLAPADHSGKSHPVGQQEGKVEAWPVRSSHIVRVYMLILPLSPSNTHAKFTFYSSMPIQPMLL